MTEMPDEPLDESPDSNLHSPVGSAMQFTGP
jgi:hypothetical protein